MFILQNVKIAESSLVVAALSGYADLHNRGVCPITGASTHVDSSDCDTVSRGTDAQPAESNFN
jgi:hypothetical protein